MEATTKRAQINEGGLLRIQSLGAVPVNANVRVTDQGGREVIRDRDLGRLLVPDLGPLLGHDPVPLVQNQAEDHVQDQDPGHPHLHVLVLDRKVQREGLGQDRHQLEVLDHVQGHQQVQMLKGKVGHVRWDLLPHQGQCPALHRNHPAGLQLDQADLVHHLQWDRNDHKIKVLNK